MLVSSDMIHMSGVSENQKQLISRSLKLSRSFCYGVLLFPILTIFGWTFNIPLLTKGHPALPAMQPNTAFGLVVGALAVLNILKKQRGKIDFLILNLIATVIAILGILTLSEYVFDLNLGIDHIFTEGIATAGQNFPGRPSPQASVNFLLLGLSLLIYSLNLSLRTGQILALLVGVNAVVSLTGYIFSTNQFYGFPIYTSAVGLAIQTAIAFMLLVLALLFSRPTEGLMSLLTSDTHSGCIARQILISGSLGPIFIGGITRIGVIAGWYDISDQISLFVTLMAAFILVKTWKAAQQSESEELQARLAFDKLHESQERLELALRGADLATWDWNIKTGEVVFNSRWAEMRGYSLDEVTPHEESWTSNIHPDDKLRVQKELNDYFQGIISEYQCEFRVKNKLGQWIWILDRGKVFTRDDSGRPVRMLGTELDITEQKRLAEEVRFSEAKSSGIVSVSADAIISIDEAQNITLFNEGAEKIFGYLKNEVIGKPISILIPVRFHEKHSQFIERFAAGQQISRRMGEHRGLPVFALRKNGQEFPVDAAISKLEVDGKKILTVALRDITEQKRIENEQRFLAEAGSVFAASLDYEKTLTSIAQMIVREFADFCIVDILEEHGELRRLKAVSRDPEQSWICELFVKVQLTQVPPIFIWPALERNEPLLIKNISSEILSLLSKSEEQLRAIHAANLGSFIVVPLLTHGKRVGVIALANSTTSHSFGRKDIYLAKKLSERVAISIENARLYRKAQRAELIADNLPALIAYWDKNQRCQFANKAYFEWFGIKSEQLIGVLLKDFLGPELYSKNLPFIEGALSGVSQTFERDLKFSSSGKMRHTSMTYIPEIINGKVLGFIVLVFDITELKDAQLAAMSEKEKALSEVKTREEILAFVSHDLKNPLTAIDLVAQRLRRPDVIALGKLQEFSDKIQRSVVQMERLIGDLLDFAKIQSGTFSIKIGSETLNNIISSVVDGFRVQAESKLQTINVDISPKLPNVAVDAHRIAQVLSNLIGNAVKFTPEKGVILISAKVQDDKILVSVSDSGPGIPSENLTKIFDRFWQDEQVKELGSGLGLAIAKGIVDAHGGKIWAESQLGKGSTIYFTVNLAIKSESVAKKETLLSKDLDRQSFGNQLL